MRFRRNSGGELMRQAAEGSWDAATEQVDWNKVDATSDAEIERHVGDLAALAEHLHVSPHQ